MATDVLVPPQLELAPNEDYAYYANLEAHVQQELSLIEEIVHEVEV